MSNKCCDIAWERDFGSASRKVVAVRFADHADSDGRGIWPSVERTAAECNLNERTVKRILKAFVAEGLLKVVHEGGRGAGDSRRYDFDMDRLMALPMVVYGVLARETSVSNDDDKLENKGGTVSPLNSVKGDTGSHKGDTGSHKGDTEYTEGWSGVTQTVREPLEPLEGGVVARAGAQDPVSRKIDDRPQPPVGNTLVERGKQACAAMGIAWNDPAWKGDVFVLTQWDAAGFDFDLDVLPTIASVTRGLGHPPDRLSYFTKPIARNHQARLAAPRLAQSGGHPSGPGKSFRSEHDMQCEKMSAAINAAFQEDEE